MQSLLQARDVQLQVLMRMLSEADVSAVKQKQQIAFLHERLTAALGSDMHPEVHDASSGIGDQPPQVRKDGVAAALELEQMLGEDEQSSQASTSDVVGST